MTRRLRLDPKMGWHHVTNHAVGNDELFVNDDQRHLFLRLLVWASTRTGVEVAGFCLMGNHFHLILHCPDGQLSVFMQLVESVYGRAFSAQRGYLGPVYVDRFHNTVITSDGQLLVASRYVDRNPLELGFDIDLYPWSSYPTHLHGTGAHDASLSRTCEFPVRLCGGAADYKAFVTTPGPSDKFPLSAGHRIVPASPYVPIDTRLNEIALAASALASIDVSRVLAPRRGARCDARIAAVYVASQSLLASSDELCTFFGYAANSSLASTIAIAKRRLVTHVGFKALVEQIQFVCSDRRLSEAS